MSKWEMVKLGEVCSLNMGQSPNSDTYNDKGIGMPFFQGNADFGTINPNIKYWCSKPVKIANVNDILISVRAPIGALNIANFKCCIGRGLAAITVDNNIAERNFIWYMLKSKVDELQTKGTGSTFKAINKITLYDVSFPLPPLEVQHQIAENLDKVTYLIDLCNALLEKLDLLVKARFVEMFGDPFINPLGWDEVSISTVVDGKVSNGFFSKRDDYIDDGNVAVLGVAYVVNRMYSQVFDLPKTNATQTDVEKFSVKYGDMLFCRSSLVAAGIGKASIVPENTPNNILFECHVIRLPLDLNKCVPEYMQVLSTMDYFRNQIISQSKTATMTTISQEGIMNANIILPPLEKQKMFYDYVKQVYKSKLAVKKLLDKSETLKKALMQKYFG